MMDYGKLIQNLRGKQQLLVAQIEAKEKDIIESKIYLENIQKAQKFIQEVAKKTQEQLKFHIEDIVQLAIDSIFPNEYKFSMEFDIKYGKTSCNLVFTKDGYQIDILKAAGGGVVDIAALGLRIAVWSLGKSDNVLVLDEPIARIQPAELQAQAWEMIRELSRRLNLQFIIISNSTNNGEAAHLVADKEYRIIKEDFVINNSKWGISTAEEIEETE